jgi:hypothetical protein
MDYTGGIKIALRTSFNNKVVPAVLKKEKMDMKKILLIEANENSIEFEHIMLQG